jgi:hypothetical protein
MRAQAMTSGLPDRGSRGPISVELERRNSGSTDRRSLPVGSSRSRSRSGNPVARTDVANAREPRERSEAALAVRGAARTAHVEHDHASRRRSSSGSSPLLVTLTIVAAMPSWAWRARMRTTRARIKDARSAHRDPREADIRSSPGRACGARGSAPRVHDSRIRSSELSVKCSASERTGHPPTVLRAHGPI